MTSHNIPQSKWNLLHHRCLVCEQPLHHIELAGQHLVWCSYGSCISEISNDGAMAPSLTAAVEKLDELLLEEINDRDIKNNKAPDTDSIPF